jgi:hypothetical protein
MGKGKSELLVRKSSIPSVRLVRASGPQMAQMNADEIINPKSSIINSSLCPVSAPLLQKIRPQLAQTTTDVGSTCKQRPDINKQTTKNKKK